MTSLVDYDYYINQPLTIRRHTRNYNKNYIATDFNKDNYDFKWDLAIGTPMGISRTIPNSVRLITSNDEDLFIGVTVALTLRTETRVKIVSKGIVSVPFDSIVGLVRNDLVVLSDLRELFSKKINGDGKRVLGKVIYPYAQNSVWILLF